MIRRFLSTQVPIRCGYTPLVPFRGVSVPSIVRGSPCAPPQHANVQPARPLATYSPAVCAVPSSVRVNRRWFEADPNSTHNTRRSLSLLWLSTAAVLGASVASAQAEEEEKTNPDIFPVAPSDIDHMYKVFKNFKIRRTRSNTLYYQMEEVRRQFQANCEDDTMTREEFIAFLNKFSAEPIDEELQKIWFRLFDVDNNGSVDLNEFIQGFTLVHTMKDGFPPHQRFSVLRLNFLAVDIDRNCICDPQELERWIRLALRMGVLDRDQVGKEINENINHLNAKQVTQRIIKKYDEDSDGVVNMTEFQTIFGALLSEEVLDRSSQNSLLESFFAWKLRRREKAIRRRRSRSRVGGSNQN